jgi:hypothetical protein
MLMVCPKDSSIMSKLEQILATSLRKERAMWEREKSGIDLDIVTIQ